MPNSLKVKLSKLRYNGKITQEEYSELIKKLDGHDMRIRTHELTNTIEEFVEFIDKHTHVNRTEICLDDDITILAEKFWKGKKG